VTPTTALIGRETELALVAERLAERRLVTLVGPGGIGKTTLARAVVDTAVGAYPDGLRVIDLTLVDEVAGVRESIAGQFGYSSFAALLDSPSDLPVLVLIDNCEHVIDAVSETVAQLLDACQMPTVLATSRLPLEIPGEAVVPLGPLPLPPVGDLDGPAVQLFLERALDAGASVSATPAVVELCRRLDGIPLALELAAARTRSMSPEEVLSRLGDGLDVLHRPRARTAPRHRSLHAAIDWSFQLLDPEAQRFFADLSVFAGPFSAAAAHNVTANPGPSVAATQDRLHELVEASMLVAEAAETSTRYRMLDTVRAWGREQLDAQGRRRDVEARFADHVAAVAAGIIERGASTWSSDALADLRLAYSSIAASVRWCLVNDDTPDRALLFVAVLWGLVHQAHTEQIGELAEQVLERWGDTSHPMLADAAATAATCRYMLGEHASAVELAVAHLDVAERSPFAPATLRRAIAQARRASGDTTEAMRGFADAADAARRLGLTSMATESESARAQALADTGRLDEALALVGAAHDEASAAGSAVGAAWADAIRGSILLRRDLREAERCLVTALERCRSLDYEAGIGVCSRSLALAALLQGDARRAAGHANDLLLDLLARGSTYELRMVLDVVSPILRLEGEFELAADLAATALTLPVVSVTASVGHELVPLDATGGRAMPAREAIRVTRDILRELVDDSAPVERGTAGTSDEVALQGRFCQRGEVWEVGLGPDTVTLRSSKGLADLAQLLASPGQEVHCLDLAAAGTVQADTGEVLDHTARRAYQERVRDLQHQVDVAEADNDLGRAERARAELDSLVDQLTAALASGGTARTTGSTTERARSAVTQRIRSTIRRIESAHPRLGRHLDAAVRTGTWCSYRPEHPVEWELHHQG
jgi:predicted ATPase